MAKTKTTKPKASGPKLKLDPKNARLHTPEGDAMIDASLDEIGPFRSIAIDGDDIVRAGNGVFSRAQERGLKVRIVDAKPDELIAVRRKDLKGLKAQRAALFDNRAGELSAWSGAVLAALPDKAKREIWKPEGLTQLLVDLGYNPDAAQSAVTQLSAEEGFGKIQTEDRAPFQQMTFVLHDSQAESVRRAVKIAQGVRGQTNPVNENSNGNALALICESYIKRHGNR